MTARRLSLLSAASLAAVLSLSAAAPAVEPGGGGGGGAATSSGSGISTRSSYDIEAEYASGVEALQAGDYADAERAFDRVLDLAPRHVQTHFLIGLAHYGQEDFKSARNSFKKALRYDDDHVGARKTLGLTYLQLGDIDDANDQLDALKARQADCGVCENADALASAVATLEGALAAGSDSSALAPSYRQAAWGAGDAAYGDAVRLINGRDFEGAVKVLRVASEALGPHPDVLNYLGYANRKLERFDAARDYYGQALAIDPMHLGAHEYLGELYVETGDLAAARAQLETLDALCAFGCAQAEELRTWIAAGGSPSF